MNQKDYRFDETRGSLVFSESKVEIELNMGENASGSFDIEEQNGLLVEGHVYSSNIRMSIENPEISGSRATVSYTFDSTGMNVGDALKGNFYIVTSRGEFVLPFVVMMIRNSLISSLGTIKNLFHFTNLAGSNWEEAVNLFNNPDFEQIISGNDASYRSLYRGLSRKGNRNVNLEEFLIGINKKQKIEYITDTDIIRLTNPTEPVQKVIRIERNGWGYTLLSVKADADFIKLSKNRLVSADFENNVCEYELTVDPSALHAGKNNGRVTFRSLYDEYAVEFEVVKNTFSRKPGMVQRKHNLYSLTRLYLDYTVKRINIAKWLIMTDEILGRRTAIDDRNIADSLMQVHSFILQERYNEAKWILDRKVKDSIDEADNELYCYYLYMNALYNADEYYSKEVTEQIESIYNNDRLNWRIAWVLMKISEEMRKSASKRFAFALEQIRNGCISPIMYLEAIKALSESPSLLIHLEDEEKKVLLYGAREGILTKDIMSQVCYQVMKVRNFDRKLLRIMELIYEKTHNDESLQSLCVMLMKGGLTGPKYFEYYKEAVEHNLSLTRLYESYMMSMDIRKDEPIPKPVLKYFSYQSTLPPKQNAYLYSYVVKNRNAMSELYLAYKDSIDRFILKELYSGNIDRNLAYLYTNILMEEMLTEDNMKALSKVLFKHRITVEDSNCVNVIMVDERLKEERVYPIRNGHANVGIFGNEYAILLEDEIGNRYYSTKDYQTEKFFMPGKIMAKMENCVSDNLDFDLFACEDSPDFLIVSEQNADRYRFLESSDEVTDEYRGKLRLPLLRYYMENDSTKDIDEVLSHVCYDDVSYKDYDEMIRTMLIRGLIDKAKDFVIHYGPENIEPKILVRLAERIIQRDGDLENREMTYILVSAFERGKYDDTGLSYLAKNYNGPIKQLRNIWRAATNFYTDTYGICEKMILQTLSTGAYIGEEADVLRQYVHGGAKLDIEMHFLSYFAHEYFVKGRPVDDYMFSEMERIYRVEEELTDVCMLAYLMFMLDKYKNKETDERQNEIICDFLRYLITRREIIFPFFAEYKGLSASAARISNYTIVEYRGVPDTRTVINYVISKERDEEEGYSREDMRDMYGGIYVKTFLMFFGETLQYYITEERDGTPQYTESNTLGISETIGDGNSDRYTMVNDVALAGTLGDYDTTIRIMEEYKYKEYLVNSIFSPQ